MARRGAKAPCLIVALARLKSAGFARFILVGGAHADVSQ
jgi:hypothetical protein